MEAAIFWMEIVCKECASVQYGRFFRKRAPIRPLTKEATKNGWSLCLDGEFLCPACIKNLVDNPIKEAARG